MSSFFVRRATRRDVDGIARVERAASALYAPYGLAEQLAQIVTPTSTLEAAIDARWAWVGERLDGVGDGLVGSAIATQHGIDVHLDEIDVVPSFARRGLGSALLGAVLEAASSVGARRITLLTVDFVPWTLGFYAHHGFRALARGELDQRLLTELHEVPEGDATQRSFEGRVVLVRTLPRRPPPVARGT